MICQACDAKAETSGDERCPLCRAPLPTSPAESLVRTRARVAKGDRVAQVELAQMLARGRASYGVYADEREAVRLLTLAAQQGWADAQLNLGVRYLHGSGVGADVDEAIAYFSAAAEQGHAVAQFSLSCFCEAGEFVPRDLERARHFNHLAAAQGHAQALDRARDLEYSALLDRHHRESLEALPPSAQPGSPPRKGGATSNFKSS